MEQNKSYLSILLNSDPIQTLEKNPHQLSVSHNVDPLTHLLHNVIRCTFFQISFKVKDMELFCSLTNFFYVSTSEYKEDEGLIPKGSSVIVRRIPIIGARPGSTSKTRNM